MYTQPLVVCCGVNQYVETPASLKYPHSNARGEWHQTRNKQTPAELTSNHDSRTLPCSLVSQPLISTEIQPRSVDPLLHFTGISWPTPYNPLCNSSHHEALQISFGSNFFILCCVNIYPLLLISHHPPSFKASSSFLQLPGQLSCLTVMPEGALSTPSCQPEVTVKY